MLCVFHTPPLTVAANQEPSGCGTTLSMADDDVMAVASELVEEKNKKGRGEVPKPVGSMEDAGPLSVQPRVLQGRKSWEPWSHGVGLDDTMEVNSISMVKQTTAAMMKTKNVARTHAC